MTFTNLLLAAAGSARLASSQAAAQSSSPRDASVPEVVVTAQRLDAARQSIQPSLGASTYTVTDPAIEALPGGDNQPLNQVILQAPGVVQDSFGQLHIRGDHDNLQYRLNGVILPEGLSVFGQTLSPAAGRQARPDHRRAAGAVRPAHRRHHRHHHQERLPERRRGLDLRRQPRDDRAERRIRRLGRRPTSCFVSGELHRARRSASRAPDGRRTRCHDHTDQCQAFGYRRPHPRRQRAASRFIAGYLEPDGSRSPTRRACSRDGSAISVERRHRLPERGPEREPAREHQLRHRSAYCTTTGRSPCQTSLFAPLFDA